MNKPNLNLDDFVRMCITLGLFLFTAGTALFLYRGNLGTSTFYEIFSLSLILIQIIGGLILLGYGTYIWNKNRDRYDRLIKDTIATKEDLKKMEEKVEWLTRQVFETKFKMKDQSEEVD